MDHENKRSRLFGVQDARTRRTAPSGKCTPVVRSGQATPPTPMRRRFSIVIQNDWLCLEESFRGTNKAGNPFWYDTRGFHTKPAKSHQMTVSRQTPALQSSVAPYANSRISATLLATLIEHLSLTGGRDICNKSVDALL